MSSMTITASLAEGRH